MSLRLHAAGLSDAGRLRRKDEDALLVDEELGLFAVADGVGGHRAGEVASRIAVEEVALNLRAVLQKTPDAGTPEGIVWSFRQAGERIMRESRKNQAYRGMATTLVIALLRPLGAWVAHVGDSRAYLWRRGELSRLTRDHSAVEQFSRDHPELDRATFEQSPLAHILTRCLGGERDAGPEIRPLSLQSGDRLLLCCDGLTDMVADRSIAEILAAVSAPEECCARLISAANDAGGKDNVTVVVVDVKTEEAQIHS